MPFFKLAPNGQPSNDVKTTVDLRHLPAVGPLVPKVRFQLRDGFAFREGDGKAPIIVQAHDLTTGPAGNSTDLASIPPMLWGVVSSYGLHTMPAILHDKLCVDAKQEASLRERLSAQRNADRVFRIALSQSGVPWAKRWVMWAAVRLFTLPSHSLLLGIGLLLSLVALWAGSYLVLAPDGWWLASIMSNLVGWMKWLFAVGAFGVPAALLLAGSGFGIALLIGLVALPIGLVFLANWVGLILLWLPSVVVWILSGFPGNLPEIGPTRA